jgi:hypothetical protein
MLSRGMGLEHLRELLLELARMILRYGASLAYGGHWKKTEDNFTFDLLHLINSEQEDSSMRVSGESAEGSDTALKIGKLYNHSAWPSYLDITPEIEAQWINCCRIVRITQERAGFSDADTVPDSRAHNRRPRNAFNAAVSLSAMRRLMMEEMLIDVPGMTRQERIPPVVARIMLGGKLDNYNGFLPGLFEEALFTLQPCRPLYVLGGFGGASEVLAKAFLAHGEARPEELTIAWHKKNNPALDRLMESSRQFLLPKDYVSAEERLNQLFAVVLRARSYLAATLNTGLSDSETRELMTTHNAADAVHWIVEGLRNNNKLPRLPA